MEIGFLNVSDVSVFVLLGIDHCYCHQHFCEASVGLLDLGVSHFHQE